MKELVTLIGNDVVGSLRRERTGKTSFRYDDAWRARENAYPLSLSLPLAAAEHGYTPVETFLWGLLPDNERILEGWAKRFQVSARNAMALLAHVGEDCAGAVRFTSPERVERLLHERETEIEWLSEKDIASRLRALRSDASAWRKPDDAGQFSLAGAQPKTALLFDGKRWGLPSGRTPTTHILKPGIPGLAGHAENEHFCLVLAGHLGLPVAHSRVERFEREVAIVVERYDRLRTRTSIVRVHQEDLCQALAVQPANKYENDGGPSALTIVQLLRASSRNPKEDVETFVDALAYNWLIAGTDAHAKNYSVLIGAGGTIRLAPIYDVASVIPYQSSADRGELRKLKLAMKIGDKYRLREIGSREWKKLATTLKLPAEAIVARVRDMAERIPDLASAVLKEAKRDGLDDDVVRPLAEGLSRRAARCASNLTQR